MVKQSRMTSAFFSDEYVCLPIFIFDEKYLPYHYDSIIAQILSEKTKIRYFKVPEQVFRDYSKGFLFEESVWILLTCYYLLHNKKQNSFQTEEIIQTLKKAWRIEESMPSFLNIFHSYLCHLEKHGWVQINQNTIILQHC